MKTTKKIVSMLAIAALTLSACAPKEELIESKTFSDGVTIEKWKKGKEIFYKNPSLTDIVFTIHNHGDFVIPEFSNNYKKDNWFGRVRYFIGIYDFATGKTIVSRDEYFTTYKHFPNHRIFQVCGMRGNNHENYALRTFEGYQLHWQSGSVFLATTGSMLASDDKDEVTVDIYIIPKKFSLKSLRDENGNYKHKNGIVYIPKELMK